MQEEAFCRSGSSLSEEGSELQVPRPQQGPNSRPKGRKGPKNAIASDLKGLKGNKTVRLAEQKASPQANKAAGAVDLRKVAGGEERGVEVCVGGNCPQETLPYLVADSWQAFDS